MFIILFIINLFLCVITSQRYKQSATEQDNYGSPNIRTVKLTYYWIANEAEYPLSKASKVVNLRTCSGQNLKQVSQSYYEAVKMEGSGILTNGKYINCGDNNCNCFEYVEGAKGSNNNLLFPFTSLAANDIKHGSLIYIKQLDGINIINEQKHNGCFKIDDTSWSFDKNHIDWYVFDKRYYSLLDNNLKLENVNITMNADCKILKFNVPISTTTSNANTPTNLYKTVYDQLYNFYLDTLYKII